MDKNPVAVIARLQQDAERIEDWLCANELALAETKTTLLLATNKEKQRDVITNSLGLVMGGKAIKQSNSIVLLGVTLHKDLTFGAHIHGVNDEPADKGLLKKLSGLLGVVSRIQNCPAKAKLMFLSATFNSKISYCIETFNSRPNAKTTPMRTKSSSKHDMQEKDSKHRGKTETDKLASGETDERQDFTDDTLQNEDTTQLPLL